MMIMEMITMTLSMKVTTMTMMMMKLWIYEIHIFELRNAGYITNQFNDQLPVGLLAQLVRALHRYRRGQGSNPGKPDFLAFFSQLHKLR